MRVLVIGSNSFSGIHCTYEEMRLGSEVLGISRSKKVSREFTPLGRQYTEEHSKHAFHQLDINTDLCDIINLINRFKPNIIYNFAAQGMVEPS